MSTATEIVPELSFDDYMAMPESLQPTEVIDGVLVVMPTPTIRHLLAKGNIYRPVYDCFARHDRGIVVMAPSDLVIRKRPKLRLRQPDIMVFSDRKAGFRAKDDPNRLFSDTIAPDLAIEILSSERTLAEKLADYASIAIDEVWFVDQEAREVRVLVLEGAGYRLAGAFKDGDRVVSTVLIGLELEVTSIFA